MPESTNHLVVIPGGCTNESKHNHERRVLFPLTQILLGEASDNLWDAIVGLLQDAGAKSSWSNLDDLYERLEELLYHRPAYEVLTVLFTLTEEVLVNTILDFYRRYPEDFADLVEELGLKELLADSGGDE